MTRISKVNNLANKSSEIMAPNSAAHISSLLSFITKSLSSSGCQREMVRHD